MFFAGSSKTQLFRRVIFCFIFISVFLKFYKNYSDCLRIQEFQIQYFTLAKILEKNKTQLIDFNDLTSPVTKVEKISELSRRNLKGYLDSDIDYSSNFE